MTEGFDLDSLNFDEATGLVTVVTVDDISGAVLMVAHADREALELAVSTKDMHYRSRTRGLWRKGETSGNVQKVVSLETDCDSDAVLARVRSEGPACHTGTRSCFGDDPVAGELSTLDRTVAGRLADTHGDASASYTRRLGSDRNLRLKKLGEEVAELVAACADEDPQRVAEESADLIYHVIVALQAAGATLRDVEEVLAARRTDP